MSLEESTDNLHTLVARALMELPIACGMAYTTIDLVARTITFFTHKSANESIIMNSAAVRIIQTLGYIINVVVK